LAGDSSIFSYSSLQLSPDSSQLATVIVYGSVGTDEAIKLYSLSLVLILKGFFFEQSFVHYRDCSPVFGAGFHNVRNLRGNFFESPLDFWFGKAAKKNRGHCRESQWRISLIFDWFMGFVTWAAFPKSIDQHHPFLNV
jgi:hypothetical protein